MLDQTFESSNVDLALKIKKLESRIYSKSPILFIFYFCVVYRILPIILLPYYRLKERRYLRIIFSRENVLGLFRQSPDLKIQKDREKWQSGLIK